MNTPIRRIAEHAVASVARAVLFTCSPLRAAIPAIDATASLPVPVWPVSAIVDAHQGDRGRQVWVGVGGAGEARRDCADRTACIRQACPAGRTADFVPHWVVWQDRWTPRLEQFARAGGPVVIGARTGGRDANNHVVRDTTPGPSLSQLCGITVEEFGLLPSPGGRGPYDKQVRPEGELHLPQRPAGSSKRSHQLQIGDTTLTAAHAHELLPLRTACAGEVEVAARWAGRFSAGLPAIIVRRLGAGRVVYAGACVTEALAPVLLNQVLADLLPAVPAGQERMADQPHPGGALHLGACGCAVLALASTD